MTERANDQIMPETLDAFADMVVLIDDDATILDVNQAFLEHMGDTRDRWINKSLRLLTVESRSTIESLIDLCLKEGRVANCSMDWVDGRGESDDKHTPVLASFSRLQTAESDPVIAICAKDVTDFKRVESDLRETERRYRYFVEQTQEGFYRLDFDSPVPIALPPSEFIQKMYDGGYIAECNDIYAIMYGYENASEMLGARLVDLHGGNNVPENLEAMQAFVRDGFQHLEIETTEYDKEGNAIHLSNSSVGIIQDDMQVSVWGTQRNITKRKEAELALRDREARLRAILDGAGDAVITIDNRGVIHDVNRVTEDMFGYSALELIGRNARILMPQPANDDEDFLAQTHVDGLGDIVGRRKDFSTFPTDIAVSEIKELDLYIVNIRDVSERKMLQREVLSIAEEEQRRIGRELHDTAQQELAGLGLMAQALLSVLQKPAAEIGDGTPQPIEITRKLIDGLKRTNQEVRRVSQGLVPVSLGAKDLLHAINEFVVRTDDIGQVRCLFRASDAVQIDDNWVAMHLFRIAQEATANALKHAEAHQVVLTLALDQGDPVLTIEDDGVGFDSSQVREGLGLRTMHYRASLIGATLTISGKPNGGTRVVCKVFHSRRDSTE